jgi:hypothetical protein
MSVLTSFVNIDQYKYYTSAMVNNGSLHYDHDRDGTHATIADCESPFRGRETDTLVAMRYQNDCLTVFTDMEGKNVFSHLMFNYPRIIILVFQ